MERSCDNCKIGWACTVKDFTCSHHEFSEATLLRENNELQTKLEKANARIRELEDFIGENNER